MQVWGLSEDMVRSAVASVSDGMYGSNIRVNELRQDGRSQRFTLRAVSSRAPGARTSASGRRTVAVSWRGHYDVMSLLFAWGATRIKSSMADYRAGTAWTRDLGYDMDRFRSKGRDHGPFVTGADAFAALADITADINAGSIMSPIAFGNL